MIFMMIIPIILTIVPVMLYQAGMLLCKKKSTVTHYVWTWIMMIYIWLVFSVTGIGSMWDIISKGGLIATFQQANIGFIPFQSDGLFTYCMNIIMLMPLGFLLPYVWKNFRNPIKVALTGFLFSVFIEFAQLPTNRLADTLERTLGWISRQVAPTLKMLKKIDAGNSTSYLKEIEDNAKLTEKHLQIIRQQTADTEELVTE